MFIVPWGMCVIYVWEKCIAKIKTGVSQVARTRPVYKACMAWSIADMAWSHRAIKLYAWSTFTKTQFLETENMFLVVWWILLNCICCVLVLSRWSGSTPISFLFPRILFPPRSKKHRECFRDRNYVSDKLMNSTKCIFCSLVLSGWFKSTPFSQFDTYFFCPRIVCQPAPQNIKHCEKRLPLK